MLNKLVLIVAVLWAAAVTAITVAFAVNRHETSDCRGVPIKPLDCGTRTSGPGQHYDIGGWLLWVGGVSLVAVVAIVIIYIATQPKEQQP